MAATVLPPIENPYQGLLALADHFVVTTDSLSMMVEVARLGRPLSLFALGLAVLGLGEVLADEERHHFLGVSALKHGLGHRTVLANLDAVGGLGQLLGNALGLHPDNLLLVR